MKKILTIVFILTAFFIAGEQAFAEDYSSTVEVLTAFDIASEPPGDTMTRAEYAQMISNIFAYDENDYSSDRIYSDVPQGYKYSNAINKLVRYGIVSASDQFFPDREITDAEAAAMLVRMLGYQIAAEKGGGYPGGYTRQASVLGLFDSTGSKTQSERAVMMLYNALEVDIMTIDYRGDYKSSGTTILSDILHGSVVRGRIVAAGGTAIESGAEAAEGEIIVGDMVMYADADAVKNFRDIIGMDVSAYYKLNQYDEYDYVTYIPRNSEVLDIPLDKLISVEGSTIKYEKDNAKTKTVKLESSMPNVIYNYHAVAEIPELGEIGTMRLISDGSGYDTVIIKDYKTYIANGFNKDELFTSFPEERRFKIDDYTVCDLLSSDGYVFAPENITENMVLSVLEYGDYILEVTVSDNVINGQATSINSVADSDAKLLQINGLEYRTTEELGRKLTEDGNSWLFNVNYTYYADIFGNIAYVDTNVGYRLKLGYCTRVGYDKDAEDDEKLIVKVFTEDNSFKKYYVYPKNGKYLLDGNYLDPVTFASRLDNPQLIGYKIKDGAISEIETAVSKPRNGLYRFSTANSGRYNSAQISFGADVILDSKAVIFNIPKSSEDISEEKYYGVTRSVQWINATSYSGLEFYATTEDAIDSNVVVWRRDYAGSTDSKAPMMAEKFVQMIDEDDNEITRIYGWQNGGEYSLTAKPDSDITIASKTLGNISISPTAIGRGDIIIGSELPDLKTGYTQLLYDCSKDEYLPSSNPYSNDNNSYYIICGEIMDKKDGVIKVKLRDSDKEQYYRINNVTPVLCTDNDITSTSYLDAEVGCTVIIFSNNGTAKGVYIYKLGR